MSVSDRVESLYVSLFLCVIIHMIFLCLFISDRKDDKQKFFMYKTFSNSNSDRRQKTSCKDFLWPYVVHSMCARESKPKMSELLPALVLIEHLKASPKVTNLFIES